MMAYKCREELVGKRFLSVSSGCGKLNFEKISEWGWRAGVIRAASHKDTSHQDLQVLVEYDDVEWHRREWISVYRDGLFHLCMVEQGLCWADRTDPFTPSPLRCNVVWPALTFSALVSTVDGPMQLNPVEFLLDKEISFKDYKQLKAFQEWDPKLPGVREYPELKEAVRRWAEQQDCQKIMMTTPSVLPGYRVEVYRSEGTTQWYTAVVIAYNEATRDLTVTDDTVLEIHNEDPALVQMRLIGDGVVESIMRGENVGIRRSRSALLQTQQQHTGRCFRGIASSNPSNRKLRVPRKSVSPPAAVTGSSVPQQSSEKDVTKAVRKRKASENHKQLTGRKKGSTKKKLLEEADNSKLRDARVHVENCLQRSYDDEDGAFSDASSNSSVELVVSGAVSDDDEKVGQVPRVVAAESGDSNSAGVVRGEEEDDCVVIVARNVAAPLPRTSASATGDDDGPLSASSPFSRMELASDNANVVSLSLRFADDRSDSGVSSLRSGSSGDERSGSRSSALSSSDEPPPPVQHVSSTVASSAPTATQANNRSPLFIPATHPYSDRGPSAVHQSSSEPVRVWRDPSLLLESEPHVRHIHSVQHQSLLMSHPPTPASAGPPPPPSSSSSSVSAGHQAAAAAAAVAAAGLYPPVPAPPLMSPHHMAHHPALQPSLYAHHSLPEMLWKQRYQLPAHLMAQQAAAHPGAEDLLERERAYAQDRHERLYRQNQEVREMEKQQQKERERMERDRQEQRDKMEKEREKQEREREQERERQEKQKAMVNKHFEESLRRANPKKENNTWNHLVSLPPPQRSSNPEEDRKRAEQEHHQREQQRHIVARSQEARDRNYYMSSSQRPPSAPSKTEYPPPAHSSRVPLSKSSSEKLSMPSNHLNMYGYPAYQPTAFYTHEPKSKSESHHKVPQSASLIVTKSNNDRDRDSLPNPPPLVSEIKSSVIVKHDGKNAHLLEPRVSVSHSQSPKLRTPEMMNHYFSTNSGQQKGNVYEYRSPTQSPHHLAHAPSPHHHLEAKVSSHHRPSGQIPSPHHQRQSPHPHPSPELRYRSNSESQAMIFQANAAAKASYPYGIAATTSLAHYTLSPSSVSNSKPKVSSPAPHHIYGKPSPGISSGIPISRSMEGGGVNSIPIPLTSKPPLTASVSPSPYHQVSQYHPPHPQVTPIANCLPPPAHSSRSSIDRVNIYDRGYPGGSVPGGLQGKPSNQLGTSPPTAASAPSSIQRPHPQYVPVSLSAQNMASSVQTQPLDLGISSNKYDSASSPKRKGTPVSSANSPVCLEIKKRRIEQSPSPHQQQIPLYTGSTPPQLARVSEPSPLIASAATTITTVVNTAAYRPPTTLIVPQTQPILADSLPDVSVTPVPMEPQRVPSADGSSQQSTLTQSSSPPMPMTSNIAQRNTDSPNTPVKLSVAPSAVDSEKSNSPGPMKSSNYPVRHLKKAWLQRHTGEDVEDNTGVTGSGSCVTLPLNINASKDATAGVTTLHNIGSMAVNSISKAKHFSGSKSGSNNRKVKDGATLNGHQADLSKGDDSSSSDQERGRKSPPKRKPPKVKRKKGGGTSKKVPDDKRRKAGSQSAAASESGSDSEKESGSDKDSDSEASTTQSIASSGGSAKKNGNSTSVVSKDKEGPRKRGRRPKTSKNDKGEEPRPKKSKDDVLPQRDPFRKPPVGQLKKTGESFLQDGPCFEVAPKLGKCRECRWTPNQRTKNMPNIFCRFYAFRRLRYTKNGQLAIAGFSDPHKDALEDDLKLWLPSAEAPPADLDLDTSRFLLRQVGDHFCDLLMQEKDACGEHMSDEKTIAWKRVVQGVREMCDVCETTLFNFHWACRKCGFVVCLDCYKGRKNGTIKVWGEAGKDRDDFSWLQCTNRVAHEQEKLMLTQIIAGDSLAKLGKMVHEMRELWNIEQYCACAMSKEKLCNGANKEIVKSILMNGIKKEIKEEPDSKVMNGIGLDLLASVAQSNDVKKNEDSSSDSDDGGHSTLRELLIRPSHKPNGSRAASPGPSTVKQKKVSGSSRMDTLDEVISSVIEDSSPKNNDNGVGLRTELKHFIRRYNWQAKGRSPLPIRIMTLTESKVLYPDTPHSWLCDGKLLRLIDPRHSGNVKIFQDQWKRGQPVIVSDVTRYLDKELWNPDSFARDFGDEKNDLVNCMTGNLVPNQPMRKFWEGFDHFSKRLKDDRGNPMLLKLKDWPPGEDFAEMLPSRFSDLMKVLPLPDYTHRTGRLNLASRLPDCFVRPDLGPKMYNAYGSALHPTKGTTNLHLDISDAVNVMVYVGIPKDGDNDEHIKEAFRAIDEAGCDILTRRRVRDKGELPGALWHIYNARDADKIRDLLNKVVVEKGGRLEPHHDPIHDQSCYLDGPLRERLYKEYGVEGYAIVQCLGDAVFIPAGAPHQVRNLHNCIKVAEDFVSPENVSHCFHLTQEFRDLSDTHSNHEDKLQIKNIIYHAVKDSLSSLSSIYDRHSVKSEERNCGVKENNNSGSQQQSQQQNSNNSDSNAEPA